MNLAVPAHMRIGYIAASNDPIPDTLRQIGIQVDLLDEVALAFEDLSRYDAIVVGIRAYDLRPDLMRSNRRLLDYVQRRWLARRPISARSAMGFRDALHRDDARPDLARHRREFPRALPRPR